MRERVNVRPRTVEPLLRHRPVDRDRPRVVLRPLLRPPAAAAAAAVRELPSAIDAAACCIRAGLCGRSIREGRGQEVNATREQGCALSNFAAEEGRKLPRVYYSAFTDPGAGDTVLVSGGRKEEKGC